MPAFDAVVDWLTVECFVVSDDLGYLNTSIGRMRSEHLQVVAGLERLPEKHMRQNEENMGVTYYYYCQNKRTSETSPLLTRDARPL